MKITELTYSSGQKIQVKQYEPRDFHFSAKAEVEEGEVETAFKELKKIVDAELKNAVTDLQAKAKKAKEARETPQYTESQADIDISGYQSS